MRHTPENCNNATMMELLNYCHLFLAVRKAALIALMLPASTCQVEWSFSTLRPVKTWHHSMMSTERLSGLCMLSVHQQKVMDRKDAIIKDVIDHFGSERRRLQLLFCQ